MRRDKNRRYPKWLAFYVGIVGAEVNFAIQLRNLRAISRSSELIEDARAYPTIAHGATSFAKVLDICGRAQSYDDAQHF
jgi:hypothetical protein